MKSKFTFSLFMAWACSFRLVMQTDFFPDGKALVSGKGGGHHLRAREILHQHGCLPVGRGHRNGRQSYFNEKRNGRKAAAADMANDLAEVRGLKTGMHYYRLEPKGLEKNVAGDLLAR